MIRRASISLSLRMFYSSLSSSPARRTASARPLRGSTWRVSPPPPSSPPSHMARKQVCPQPPDSAPALSLSTTTARLPCLQHLRWRGEWLLATLFGLAQLALCRTFDGSMVGGECTRLDHKRLTFFSMPHCVLNRQRVTHTRSASVHHPSNRVMRCADRVTSDCIVAGHQRVSIKIRKQHQQLTHSS